MRRPARAGGRFVAVVVITTTACLGAACTSDGSSSAPTSSAAPRSTTSRPGGSTAGGSTDPRPATDLADARVALQDLRLGLTDPIDLTVRPDSTSLLVAERGGVVREAVAEGDGFRVADRPVLDITARVGETTAEKGLLGVAVSPEGDELYVSYTETTHGDSRVDAYPLSGRDGSLRADVDGRRQLLAITQPFANHNGGSLRTDPDGLLYAGFGDGGAGGDPDGNGQDRTTRLGKILRLDPNRPDGVATGNPFADGGGDPLVWATGLRNPWRIDLDPTTGDLWIGDVGQDRFEEIDVLRAADGGGRGANLGWDLYEGTSRFDAPDPAPGAASAGPFTAPVEVYSHQDGCSVTGGVVYRGKRIPALDGAYLYGDYCSPGVRAIRVDGTTVTDRADLGVDVGSVVSFARDPDGEVLVISLDDGIKRLVPA